MLGIFEIADQVGMSRSTTHRYVITLLALGYLEQGTSSKYRLGIRPIDLGMAALDSTDIRDPARPHLEKLHRSTGYSIGLGTLNHTRRLIDHLCNQRYSQEPDGPEVRVGVRVPAYCTSIGKLLLAFLPKDERESILAKKGRAGKTKHTITKKQLKEQLAEIPTLGYAISDEEFYLRVRSLAVPVRDDTGVVAAVNLSVYEGALSVQDLVDFYPLVDATAEKVSRTLGYDPTKMGIEASDC